MQQTQQKYLHVLISELKKHSVSVSISKTKVACKNKENTFEFFINADNNLFQPSFPLDILVREPEKIAGIILSKLKCNTVVYARQCTVTKINKTTAEEFLDKYHLMNSTQSSGNVGLFYKDELVAVASFSAGRKMNRLPADKRSFEMIRFCTRKGVTVAGGLTRLLQYFIREKKAGDVMTYVDKSMSEGETFKKAGFVYHSTTPAHHFIINRKTFERTSIRSPDEKFDDSRYYLFSDAGSIKMVFVPKDQS